MTDPASAPPPEMPLEDVRAITDRIAKTAWLKAQQAAAGDDAVASMERLACYAGNLADALPSAIIQGWNAALAARDAALTEEAKQRGHGKTGAGDLAG